MGPWVETVAVVQVAALGVMLGRASRRLRAPYWGLGYAMSLGLVAILVLARCGSSLHFTEPFAWIVAGRMRFVVVTLAVTLGLSTLLPRLPRRWERVTAWLLMTAFLVRYSIIPFAMPALVAEKLARLQTTFDPAGVCLQTTQYTCGPAAAVTALKQLGLSGQEGQIAALAHTSPWVGTLPACLNEALRDRYASQGLRCRFRRFDSVAELQQPGVTLAVVRDTFRRDHCVTVLNVTDEAVTLADPALGMTSMTPEQFEAIWRFAGIVLTRTHAEGQNTSTPRDT